MADTFTITQVTYNFTATVSNPAELVLASDPENVIVTDLLTTVTVINSISPVTVEGPGGGTVYNQSLNTGDNVAFASVTTPSIYGSAGQPVYFPNGISAQNVGTLFNGSVDLGSTALTTITNQLSLIFYFLGIDMGTISSPAAIILDFNA